MFYDRFLELCDKKRVKPTNACIEAGLSRGLAAKWKSTGTEKPSADALEKLSSYFNMSIDEILKKEKAPAEAEASDPLSQVSFALFGKHEELDDEILGELREYARFKLEQKKHKEKK